MAKKKKTQAAHDLIDSLMDDLKEISSSEETAVGSEGSALFALEDNDDMDKDAVGLSPDDFRVMEDPPGLTIWKEASDNSSVTSTAEDDLFSASKVIRDVRSANPGLFDESQISDTQSQFQLKSGALPNLEVPSMGDHSFSGIQGLVPEAPQMAEPSADEEKFQGPSADEGFQSIDEIFSSSPVPPKASGDSEDEKTRPIGFDPEKTRPVGFGEASTSPSQMTDPDRTLAAEGFAGIRPGRRPAVDEKVGIGSLKSTGKPGSSFTFADASLVQAENLKLAQNRILELEKEVERLRSDNEELASAAEIIKTRSDEYHSRLGKLEKEKQEVEESHRAEVLVLKGNLQYKETEVAKARLKVDELETRLKNDFKKIRVKERELENRLELARAEKAALLRSKDEYILDLKRKIDQLQSELDNYRSKVLELNKTLDSNQEQFKRTVRALRLALTNLELKDGESVSLKKAE